MEVLVQAFSSLPDRDGSGVGSVSGSSAGFGYGFDYGYGYGYGSGSGDDTGRGSGRGYGCGCGCGYDSCDDDANAGIFMIDSQMVYQVDGVSTILTSLHGNVARGFILQADLSLVSCFVVKERDKFAHGATLHDAVMALQEKLYNDSNEEERLAAFKKHFPVFDKKYPAREFFTWHHILTGSCKAGREAFCRDRGIDLDKDRYTVYEFILKTLDSYGGHIIKRLIE